MPGCLALCRRGPCPRLKSLDGRDVVRIEAYMRLANICVGRKVYRQNE